MSDNRMNNQPVIQTIQLSKSYKRGTWALDNLNLTVNRGEIFGYLGPNGAGKTTTIRLLLDIIRPNKGHSVLLGMDAQKDAVELHKRIGFLPGELNLWDSLTGIQVIRYLGRIHGNLDMGYVHTLAERIDLDLSKTIRSYSSGNRRKLGLVIALMHKSELLILDEPTNGLDPLIQQIFHQIMREVQAEGRTVFLSSHILSEVQAICERVGILREGKLQTVERVADLTHVNFQWITVRFAEAVNPALLDGIPGVSELTTQDEGHQLHFRYAGDFDPILRKLSSQYIVSLRTADPTLEQIFLTFYGPNATNGKLEPVKEGVK